MQLNPKVARKCAFCKYWYDPINAAITPGTLKGYWKITDLNMRSRCLKTSNLYYKAGSTCSKYESKL